MDGDVSTWVELFWNVLYWVGISLAILIGILVLLMILGSFMLRYHTVSRSLEFPYPPETLWQTITDYPSVPSWHKEVLTVERLDDRNGHEVWRETYKGEYPITLETTEAIPPTRLVRHIADEKGPFTGRWEYDLEPTKTGCLVTITEHGDIANPFFRLMARLFMNPALYLEMYLQALGKKFDVETPIQEKK